MWEREEPLAYAPNTVLAFSVVTRSISAGETPRISPSVAMTFVR
jgi:hypothetical protein